MFDGSIILALCASGACPVTMRPTPPEFVTIVVALLFLAHQACDMWKANRWHLFWVLIGGVLWWLLASWLLIGLDTWWESGAFLTLVAANVWIAFSKKWRYMAPIIFLDVTTCFALCHLLIPGRWVGFGYTSSFGYTFLQSDLTREAVAITINMVTLVVLLVAYGVSNRKKLLASTS